MKTIKVNAWLETGFVGCNQRREVEVCVTSNYDIVNDPEKVIEDEVREWMFDKIEWGWDINEDN